MWYFVLSVLDRVNGSSCRISIGEAAFACSMIIFTNSLFESYYNYEISICSTALNPCLRRGLGKIISFQTCLRQVWKEIIFPMGPNYLRQVWKDSHGTSWVTASVNLIVVRGQCCCSRRGQVTPPLIASAVNLRSHLVGHRLKRYRYRLMIAQPCCEWTV